MAPSPQLIQSSILFLFHTQIMMLKSLRKDVVARLRVLDRNIRALDLLNSGAAAGRVQSIKAGGTELILQLAEMNQERSELTKREDGYNKAIAAGEQTVERLRKTSGSDTEMGGIDLLGNLLVHVR